MATASKLSKKIQRATKQRRYLGLRRGLHSAVTRHPFITSLMSNKPPSAAQYAQYHRQLWFIFNSLERIVGMNDAARAVKSSSSYPRIRGADRLLADIQALTGERVQPAASQMLPSTREMCMRLTNVSHQPAIIWAYVHLCYLVHGSIAKRVGHGVIRNIALFGHQAPSGSTYYSVATDDDAEPHTKALSDMEATLNTVYMQNHSAIIAETKLALQMHEQMLNELMGISPWQPYKLPAVLLTATLAVCVAWLKPELVTQPVSYALGR